MPDPRVGGGDWGVNTPTVASVPHRRCSHQSDARCSPEAWYLFLSDGGVTAIDGTWRVETRGGYFVPIATIFRLRKAIWVRSDRSLGQTSWQPRSDMHPKTPLSSPISS
jgi:hypothetical protein